MHLQFFFATFLLQKKANKGWVILSTSGLIGVQFLHYRTGVGLDTDVDLIYVAGP